MDLVLTIADNIILDRVWSSLVPPAFKQAPVFSTNSTSYIPTPSTLHPWHLSLLARLPRPSDQVVAFANSLPPAYKTPDFLASFESPPEVLSAWPRNYIPRQLISLTVITLIGITLLYFIFSSLSYFFIFNHEMMKHPRFLKNQIRMEIWTSLKSFPGMTICTLPFFQAEVMGYSRLYDDPKEYGYTYLCLSIPLFVLFIEYGIYWIHRWLHHPAIYKYIHKPHHKWIIPTPFASFAFHFLDGFAQSIPYHVFVMLFPLHRVVYLGLFLAVNFWTILIHDSDMVVDHALVHVINTPAHHTLHHMYFTCNYGQYFTWADRLGGSYKHPRADMDPLNDVKELEGKKSH